MLVVVRSALSSTLPIISTMKTLYLESKQAYCYSLLRIDQYNRLNSNQQISVKLSYGDAVPLGGFKSGLTIDNREY